MSKTKHKDAANTNAAPQAAAAPAADAPAAAKQPFNLVTACAQLKQFLGVLVSENLDMAIAVMHLVQFDLERQYGDQLRYAEIRKAQLIAEEVQKKNAAAAEGTKAPAGDAGTDAPGAEPSAAEQLTKESAAG